MITMTRTKMSHLWQDAQYRTASVAYQAKRCADLIDLYRDHYLKVEAAIKVPFYIVGVIHYMEASFNFERYLANGDPLRDHDGHPIKTTHVPRGLGPFGTWEEAAVASLKYVGWNTQMKWDLTSALLRLEAYNGIGYRKRNVYSPYLWSGMNHYSKGLYVSDGKFDPTAISKRPGCVAVLLQLREMGVDLNES